MILPVVAPVGTVVTILVVLLDVGVAAIPLNNTVFSGAVGLKLVPVIVTEVPSGPLVGSTSVIVGRGNEEIEFHKTEMVLSL